MIASIKNKIKLSFETCIIGEEGIWFSAFDHNGLYFKGRLSKKAILVGVIPNERKYALRLYASMVRYENKIFLIPFLAKEVAVYDIDQKEFKKIPLKKVSEFGDKKLANEMAKFWCSKLYKDTLFLFPHNYPALVMINVHTYEVSYLSEFVYELETLSINREPYITDIYVENHMVYGSCACANVVLQVDLVEKSVNVCKIPVDANGFNGITKIGNEIWLAPRIMGGIVCFNIKGNIVSVYDKYPEGFQYSCVPFHTLYQCADGILLIPDLSNQFVLLDIQTKNMKSIGYLSNLIDGERLEGTYSFDKTMAYSMNNDQLRFMSGKDYTFYLVNINSNRIQQENFYSTIGYPDKSCLSIGVLQQNINLFFCENIKFGLLPFLVYVEEMKELETEERKSLKEIGEEIYEKLSKL